MDLGLDGKVCWVLGASSGLGRAAALSLAREKAQVAVSAGRAGALHELVAQLERDGGRSLAVPLDVTDRAAIPAAAELIGSRLGAVDVLVANAGGPPYGGFQDVDATQLEAAFSLTLASAWHLAKAVVPSMKQRGSGCLIFLTSSSTKEVIEHLILSNMMRAGVVAMAKTMSKELGPHGIRVLCVAPGRVETDRVLSLDLSNAQRSGRTPQQVRASSEAGIPLRRYGRTEEFGDVVAWLASERASYVTGTSVMVDGGHLHGVLS